MTSFQNDINAPTRRSYGSLITMPPATSMPKITVTARAYFGPHIFATIAFQRYTEQNRFVISRLMLFHQRRPFAVVWRPDNTSPVMETEMPLSNVNTQLTICSNHYDIKAVALYCEESEDAFMEELEASVAA
jgi:hypothetical protein